MQGNKNLHENSNSNSNYARLPDDAPPYQPQPVIIDDSQPIYGQPQPYNQPYTQNQGFNNQPFINQNQGLANPID